MQASIITQAGVSYVKSEYEAIGEDVDAIQMHYIKIAGVENAWHGTDHNALRNLCGISFFKSCSSTRSRSEKCGIPKGYHFLKQRVS